MFHGNVLSERLLCSLTRLFLGLQGRLNHCLEAFLGFSLPVEQQWVAKAPPRISIRDAPEGHELDVLAMLQEDAEEAAVLVGELLIRGVHQASAAGLSVLRHFRALAALAALRGNPRPVP